MLPPHSLRFAEYIFFCFTEKLEWQGIFWRSQRSERDAILRSNVCVSDSIPAVPIEARTAANRLLARGHANEPKSDLFDYSNGGRARDSPHRLGENILPTPSNRNFTQSLHDMSPTLVMSRRFGAVSCLFFSAFGPLLFACRFGSAAPPSTLLSNETGDK